MADRADASTTGGPAEPRDAMVEDPRIAALEAVRAAGRVRGLWPAAPRRGTRAASASPTPRRALWPVAESRPGADLGACFSPFQRVAEQDQDIQMLKKLMLDLNGRVKVLEGGMRSSAQPFERPATGARGWRWRAPPRWRLAGPDMHLAPPFPAPPHGQAHTRHSSASRRRSSHAGERAPPGDCCGRWAGSGRQRLAAAYSRGEDHAAERDPPRDARVWHSPQGQQRRDAGRRQRRAIPAVAWCGIRAIGRRGASERSARDPAGA